MTTSRHDQRARALAILYEADLRGRPPMDVLAEHVGGEEPPISFAIELVEGVDAVRDDLDARIGEHARGWKVARMPVVDRNVLRLGLYEILHTEVPDAVAIDEAVELAKELSTEASGGFINGVLARAAEERAAG